MFKKIIGIAIVLSLVFVFVACNGNLTQYKTDAKAEIANYIATLNVDDYTTENWVVIEQKAADGIVAVDKAINKNEVDTAKAAAITAIDEVSKEIRVSISFEEISMSFGGGENLSIIIKSTEELTALLAEKEWLSAVSNRWIDFDVEFFANKALILYFAITSSVSVSYLLDDIQIVGDNLKIYLVGQHYGDIMLDAEGFASFVVMVEKSDIENITSFDTDVRYENLEGSN